MITPCTCAGGFSNLTFLESGLLTGVKDNFLEIELVGTGREFFWQVLTGVATGVGAEAGPSASLP